MTRDDLKKCFDTMTEQEVQIFGNLITEFMRRTRCSKADGSNSTEKQGWTEEQIKRQTREILRTLNTSNALKGYHYVQDAVVYLINATTIQDVSITKELYPEVAKKNDTTAKKVERNIRHTIESTLQRSNQDNWKKVFPYMNNKKPTNSEYLIRLAEMVKDMM